MKKAAWVFGLLFVACATQSPVSEGAPASLPWGNEAWDAELKKALRTELPNLNKASDDMKRFCPKYKDLTSTLQVEAWAHLAVAVAKRESGWKVGSSMTESTGQDSIGLFQLSYGDRFCPKKKSEGSLVDPLVNIRCAVKLMGHFVGRDKVVAGGGYTKYGAPPAKGAADYWSVLRVKDKKKSHHLPEIMAKTKMSPGCV